MEAEILKAKGLKKYFKVKRGMLRAVDDLSFSAYEKESIGIVGESGSGKSTLAKLILGLLPPTEGEVFLFGRSLKEMTAKENHQLRKSVQVVFQNPYLSLFPHLTVGANIEEPLRLHRIGSRKERREKAIHLMEQVGVSDRYYFAFPHELSGGQQQRVAIARALALNPRLILFDEPVSSLDVSIQAQILNLLLEIKEKKKLTYLFIAHDLAVVEYVSTTIAVMYLGAFVELAPTNALIREPLHPYTEQLLASVPVIGGSISDQITTGEVPSPVNPPTGCPFHPRCSKRMERCVRDKPVFKEVKQGHFVACHLY